MSRDTLKLPPFSTIGICFEPDDELMLSVLIVDDYVVVRSGMKHIINEEFRITMFGEATTPAQAISALAKRAWDLVVLGTSLPGQERLQALRQILERRPGTRVLMCGLHADQQHAARVLRHGACGYISKTAPRADLVKALKAALARPSKGGNVPLTQPAAAHEVLSKREYRVMLAIAAGKRVGQIASELSLSPKTISTYKRRVLNKMSLHSAADVVRYVVDHGLS